jgi:carbon-monoxide dehydrogenase small subunit
MTTKTIKCRINGEEKILEVDIRQSLLEVLRQKLFLTGTKQGCGVGECGVCTVLVDGETVNSCLYLAIWADGKTIRTVEGESKDGRLSEVQQALLDEGAVQCGFCTPGFVMSLTALAESGKSYTRDEIKKELSGHMCRCTGYQNIMKAADKVLKINAT